jgi:hypothetical protein
MEGKRRTVDYISGTDFEPGFRFGTSDKAKLLKTSGEPGRTRTCNPLIKSQLLYH